MKVTDTKLSSRIVMNTKGSSKPKAQIWQWWTADTQRSVGEQLVASATFLKDNQDFRNKQAATYARLYGNMSLFNFVGGNLGRMDNLQGLPADRPTFNIVQSCIDTVVSRNSQNRPSPVFLTDGGDYKARSLSKKLNNFVQGEFYHTKAYEKATTMLRDGCTVGTGCLKVYAGQDNRVQVERRLLTELFVDPNEAVYGEPRTLYEIKLVDRQVLAAAFPKFKSLVQAAEAAYVDGSADTSKTMSDMVIVVEGWRLKSGKGCTDGRHTIACSAGVLYDEKDWDKDRFPFVFFHYSPRLLGFWAQGLAEQLMGTQLEINSLLFTISRSIRLVGVPKVLVEEGSKVNTASFNNEIGTIVKYQGVKPEYVTPECVPQELYAQLQRLIDYGYQQSGVSALQASSQKPSGLDSGEAIRTYDDISTDRFAAMSRRYDNVFIDLAYLVVDTAKDIAEEEGEYSTVYPGKTGTLQVDLPEADMLKDSYVIQCFNQSSLPKDPAGRLQKVTEMVQAGMISLKEGRRLLDFPDTQQMDKLATASEERIFKYLDMIVEEGKYTPPDPFMDIDLATESVVQYYNLYVASKLEEDRAEMLRDFYAQCLALKQAAMPPAAPGMPPGAAPGAPGAPQPQAAPEPAPTSPLIPNAPGMAA